MKRILFALLAVAMLAGCEQKLVEVKTTPAGQYEDVKIDGYGDMYRVTVYCPNQEPQVFLAHGGLKNINENFAFFYDYLTGTDMVTSCPVTSIRLKKKKELPSGENLNQYLNQPAQDKPQAKVEPKEATPDSLGRIVINNNVGTQNN